MTEEQERDVLRRQAEVRVKACVLHKLMAEVIDEISDVTNYIEMAQSQRNELKKSSM